MRCKPEEDATRCQFLHRKCNEHVDTSSLSFQMRVTLSECTVEDVLCHLGHRTPVMCCQDQYSECVERSASQKISMQQQEKDPEYSGPRPSDIINKTEKNEHSEDPFLFLLGIDDADVSSLSVDETNL